MLKKFTADLHIHSCLSPCAEVDMTPRRIIAEAIRRGIDIIAISDHNSAENLEIALKIAEEKDVLVLPALEITSSEEAHLLALFGSVADALSMQGIVYRNLPDGVNDEKFFGYQLIVNENDEILRFNRRLLINTVGLPLKGLIDTVHSLGGLAVASHIDREAFSVISQLGFIPGDMAFDALEISCGTGRERAEQAFRDYMRIPWITSSDAHNLSDVGKKATSFFLEEASFQEIAAAFRGEREIRW